MTTKFIMQHDEFLGVGIAMWLGEGEENWKDRENYVRIGVLIKKQQISVEDLKKLWTIFAAASADPKNKIFKPAIGDAVLTGNEIVLDEFDMKQIPNEILSQASEILV